LDARPEDAGPTLSRAGAFEPAAPKPKPKQPPGKNHPRLSTGAQRLVTARTVAIFRYACPHCAAELTQQDEALFCTREGRRFTQEAGIWRLLRRERAAELRPFVEAYNSWRDTEDDSGSPRSRVPAQRVAGHGDRQRLRGLVFLRVLRASVVNALGSPTTNTAALRVLDRVLDREFRDRPVRALDLGAGSGWLARRLAARGYAVCALDIRTDPIDGLGAGQVYRDLLASRFERVEAEMECLPFVAQQFELVIANNSLHYSANLDVALDEARRVLAPNGIFIWMGSPFSHEAPSAAPGGAGRRREPAGPPTGAAELTAGPNLTYAELPHRLQRHSLEGEVRRPFPGLRQVLRSCLARLRGGPEPLSYPLVICRPAAPEV
jgi:SAM-dependent methyltransferase